MPKYIPIHTNTCSLIQYVPIRPLHIPDACAGGELRSLAGRRRPRLAQARAGGGLLSPAVAALDRDVLVASCSRGLLSPSVVVFVWLYFCGAICGY